MRKEYLVFGQTLIEESEIEVMVNNLRAAWLRTGPKVAAVERFVAEYEAIKHKVSWNTTASH